MPVVIHDNTGWNKTINPECGGFICHAFSELTAEITCDECGTKVEQKPVIDSIVKVYLPDEWKIADEKVLYPKCYKKLTGCD